MYAAFFDFHTTNYIAPSDIRGSKANPRFCFAIRPAGTDEPWDMIVASMLEWQEKKWYKKDWITDDPRTYCGKAWADQEEEKDNDWLSVDYLSYNPTTRELDF